MSYPSDAAAHPLECFEVETGPDWPEPCEHCDICHGVGCGGCDYTGANLTVYPSAERLPTTPEV